jgi:sulfur carrier protein ThiS
MRIEEKKKVRVGKVKKDKSGEDWIVPVYVDGKFNDDMTYYAGNGKEAKKDAEGTRDQMIKDMKNSKEYELEEDFELETEETIIDLKDDIVIRQDDRKIILEKGDKIMVIKERFEPNDILTLSSGFLARYAGSNKYNDIERFQNKLFIWVRDEVAEGRRFNSHVDAIEAFIAERDEYRRTHNTYEIEVFESVKISQEDHDIILEKGDKIRILEDEKFNYMMLDRLRQDCVYAINQSKSTRQLWGKTVDAHIAEMRRLYSLVKEKPEWLSLEDIDMYEKELKKLEKSGK